MVMCGKRRYDAVATDQLVTRAKGMEAYRLATIWSDLLLFPFLRNNAYRPSANQLSAPSHDMRQLT